MGPGTNVFEQEIRSHRRRPTATGKVSIFSGKVFCADCGAKLYYCTANSFKPTQDHFTCANYSSNTGSCSAHFIREVTLERMVFGHIKNVLAFIQQFEESFVRRETAKANEEHREAVEKAKVDIVTLRRRDEGLNVLFKRTYEDMVSGRLTEEMLNDLVDKIIVHAPDKSSGQCLASTRYIFSSLRHLH